MLFAAPAAADPDAGAGPAGDELDRVFKNYHRPQRAPVALVIDGTDVAGDAPILLELGGPDSPPAAPAAPVLAALTPRLRPEVVAALRAAVRGHRLSLDALRARGLAVVYDPHRLELRIDVPPRLTRTVSHDFGAGTPAGASEALGPADASGYVNLRGRGSTERAFELYGDAVVNIERWALQGRADAIRAPGAAATGHRGDVLLVRDFPASAVRFMAGDFAVPPSGLQANYPVLGIAVGRDFSLQPYRLIRPVGSFDFVLERAAKVTVLVNGAPVQTLSLAAGRHDVRDLPLAATVNDIELLIRDGSGERRIAFSLTSPDALLAPGLVQFSFGGGVPLLSDTGLRSYDLAHPVASGRLRAGVTSWLTLGGSFDADRDLQIGGVAAVVATPLGRLSLDVATSRALALGDGHAAGARYDYGRSAGGATTALAILGHAYDPRFRTQGPQAIHGQTRGDLGIAASRLLAVGLLCRLDLRYELGRSARDAQSALFGAAHGFGSVMIDASVSVNHGARDETRVLVTAHWTLPDRHSMVHSASRASSVSGLSNEITYSGHSDTSPGGLASSVTLSEDPGDVGTSAEVQYTGYRFTTALEGHAAFDRAGRLTAREAAIEAATAIAFVGNRATLSRPLSGSFVMIERHDALDGVMVGINPTPGGYTAEADWLARAVVPNLESYRIGHVVVDAPALPLGLSLGATSFTVLPTYKSGTLISVGEAGTVCMTGILLHYNGEPVSDAIVELFSVEHPHRAPGLLMTNRAGRFSVTGLDPGRYALRRSGEAKASGELVIPSGTRGLYAARIVELP